MNIMVNGRRKRQISHFVTAWSQQIASLVINCTLLHILQPLGPKLAPMPLSILVALTMKNTPTANTRQTVHRSFYVLCNKHHSRLKSVTFIACGLNDDSNALRQIRMDTWILLRDAWRGLSAILHAVSPRARCVLLCYSCSPHRQRPEKLPPGYFGCHWTMCVLD